MVNDIRIRQILQGLEECYQGATSALEYRNPFELLIATILSAQTTDKQVNNITKGLFKKYSTPQKIMALTEEQLAEMIKGCGLYRNKAKNIKKTCEKLVEDYNSTVPQDREKLMKLPGVGRKTANVVLANAFGIPALAVDTHVARLAHRLKLAQGKRPQDIEEQLMALIPPEKWNELHHWLIWHGRKICKAQKPLCAKCPINKFCPSNEGGKFNETP